MAETTSVPWNENRYGELISLVRDITGDYTLGRKECRKKSVEILREVEKNDWY